jgi:low affinity Fe/Cu permease
MVCARPGPRTPGTALKLDRSDAMHFNKTFSNIANSVAVAAGRPVTFVICLVTIVVWAVSGPIFKFSDTWQLVINTGTTIVTFLMVFLIQNTQNRETSAMQVKLDELIYCARGAQNRMIGIEHLTDTELEALLAEAERRAEAPPGKRDVRSFENDGGTKRKAKASGGGARPAKPKAKPRKRPARK